MSIFDSPSTVRELASFELPNNISPNPVHQGAVMVSMSARWKNLPYRILASLVHSLWRDVYLRKSIITNLFPEYRAYETDREVWHALYQEFRTTDR